MTVPRPWFALLSVLLLAVSAVGPVHAQSAQSVLNDISVVATAPGETHVVLTFAPQRPKFSVTENEGEHPTVAFDASARGSSARAPAAAVGLLKSVDFEQQQNILLVHLTVAPQVTMTAAATGDQVITVTLKTDASSKPIGSDAASTGHLPKATEAAPGADGFEVVPLKYADVSEVVGLLTDGLTVKSNDDFRPTEPAFGSASMTGGQTNPIPPPNPDTPDQSLAQSLDSAIGIDRRLNAVILKGTPQAIARLKEKIAQIDLPVPSVILETMFVELDESGAKNVGFNFNNPAGQIGQMTFTSEGFTPAGLATNHGIVSASLQAALYAQIQVGHGRIVSKPRIAAQSGSTAKIITGDALPILTSIALSGVNAVSQQVQYVNVGVTLQIAPRVSTDGYVTSHVFCVVSSVTGASQGYPTISQREASTSATVRDGETFVIGGLTQDSDIVSKSRVPGLGDIPVLGEIFHQSSETKSKTELYIVVTPHIVRRPDPAP